MRCCFLIFQVQRVEALDAGLDLGGNAAFDHFVANGFLHFEEKLVEDFLFGGELFLQLEESLGLEIAEGEIFEFAADQAHAEAIGDGGVNIESLAGDALLAVGIEKFERAHIVEAVGELDHDDADVIDHGEQHFADVFGLASFGGEQIETADLGGAFDEAGDVGAEYFGDRGERNFGVFDDVVEQSGAERDDVELHVREEVRNFDGMREERLAGKAGLRFVLLGGEIVGAAEKVEVVAGTIAADFVD